MIQSQGKRVTSEECPPYFSNPVQELLNVSLEYLGRDEVLSPLVCDGSHLSSCPQHQNLLSKMIFATMHI